MSASADYPAPADLAPAAAGKAKRKNKQK